MRKKQREEEQIRTENDTARERETLLQPKVDDSIFVTQKKAIAPSLHPNENAVRKTEKCQDTFTKSRSFSANCILYMCVYAKNKERFNVQLVYFQ